MTTVDLFQYFQITVSKGCNSDCRMVFVASGMETQPFLAMSKADYLVLAEQKYNDLQALNKQPTMYDYEKSFEAIWLDLGRQVMERNLGPVPNDRRKKKKIVTRFGEIQIANRHPFSTLPNGFGISPYLQEKLVFLGQSEVYKLAGELACEFFRLPNLTSQIYRLTNHYGAAIVEELDAVPACSPLPEASVGDVIYAQADGALLLTEQGYKEAKLGRIFSASAIKESVVDERGGHIESSLFVGHPGNSTEFSTKFETQLEPHKSLDENLVFINDGAVWLRQMAVKICPKVTLILDFYHAMEHIGEVAKAAFEHTKGRTTWFNIQRKLILDSRLDDVLDNILDLKIDVSLRGSVCSYLASNRDRMDYKLYRERGLLIGSGAIESTHRTVMQKRLKRSGQRWSIKGAQCVLNLRVCLMSKRWNLVRNQIEPYNYAMGA